MITYRPLWKTMAERGASTYTLRKGGISGSTMRRLQAEESVSTNTLDMLCKLLECEVCDILQYIPDPETPHPGQKEEHRSSL